MSDLTFGPGATGEALASTFQRQGIEVGNVRGGPSGGGIDYFRAYLAWAEAAELAFSNVLALESVDWLVRTPGYWALRAIDGHSPSVIQAVSRECDRQRARFDQLFQSTRAEVAHWQAGSAFLVVPDTNTFLEADLPFETIDWAGLSDAHITRIVVPIVVIHELDRLKRQGGQPVARAARHALRWIEDVRPKAPGAKSINLTPGPQTTLIEIYVDQGPMRRVDADGDIIGFARRLEVLSGQPTKLVTRDLGMRLRAEGAAVEVMQLIDPPTLKVEPTE